MADLAGASARWLAEQDARALLIAREITRRRTAYSDLRETERWHEGGVISGLRLALSYFSGRPGDISDTGAEGFIGHVEAADEYVRKGADDA